MLFYIDESHYFNRDIAEKISNIIFNSDFIQLQTELEKLYGKLKFEKPEKQALEDALYTFFSQDESFKSCYRLRYEE